MSLVKYRNEVDNFLERIVLKDAAKSFERAVLVTLFNRALVDRIPANDFVKFVHQCQKLGADPTINQAYLIPYENWKTKEITGQILFHYSFMEAVANREGDYEGFSRNTIVDGYFNPSTSETTKMLKCTAVVRRGGREFPFVAWFKEYAKVNNKTGDLFGVWKTAPYMMLEKCALAGALRRAYPEAMSGVYIQEEQGFLENVETVHELEVEEKHSEKVQAYEKMQERKKEVEAIESGEKEKIINRIKDMLTIICKEEEINDASAKVSLLFKYSGVRSFKDLSKLKAVDLSVTQSKLNGYFDGPKKDESTSEPSFKIQELKK